MVFEINKRDINSAEHYRQIVILRKKREEILKLKKNIYQRERGREREEIVIIKSDKELVVVYLCA